MHSPTAGVPAGAGAASSMARLDRILALVTQHEDAYRQQDMRLSDVANKLFELESRVGGALAPLQERDVPRELDLARAAMEKVVRQLAAATQANQALQSELRASQQKQQQQAAAQESALAQLRAELAALQRRVDGGQAETRRELEQLHSSRTQQAALQAQEAQRALAVSARGRRVALLA